MTTNKQNETDHPDSLRTITKRSTNAIHTMNSHLGTLNATRKEVADFAKQIAASNEAISEQIVASDTTLNSYLRDEFRKLATSSNDTQDNIANIYNLLDREITERKKLQKEIEDIRLKKQKHLKIVGAILFFSIGFSLTYISYPFVTSYFFPEPEAAPTKLMLDDLSQLPKPDKIEKVQDKVKVKAKGKPNK